MEAIFAKTGSAAFLSTRLNDSWPSGGKDLVLKLAINDPTIDETSVASDFTEVSTEAGYDGGLPLVCGDWVIDVNADPNSAEYARQYFNFTGALTDNATVYWYYVVDADGVLQWSSPLPAAITPVDGTSFYVHPRVNLSRSYIGAEYGDSTLTDDGAYSFLQKRFNDVDPAYGLDLTFSVHENIIELRSRHDSDEFTVANLEQSQVETVLTAGNWVVNATTTPPQATYATQSFIHDGYSDSDPIYGWNLKFEDYEIERTDATSYCLYDEGILCACNPEGGEQGLGSFVEDDVINITPKIQIHSEEPIK